MKKAIAFGDSVLKGVILDTRRCTDTGTRYMITDNSFTQQCGSRMNMEIENYGKFGSTVTTGSNLLDRHVDEICKSHFTLLEFGGNDSDYNWNEIAANPSERHSPHTDLRTFSLAYKNLIDKVKRLGSRPIMLSLPPLDPDMYFEHVTKGMDTSGKANVMKWLGGSTDPINNWHELYNLQVFKLGMALNVPVVDITSVFLFKKDFREYMCQDGIHPNEKGHRLIADAICDHFNFKR